MANFSLIQQLNKTFNNSDADPLKLGIGGFTSLIRLKETIQYSNTITDNPVESGAIIQEHSFNNPLIISIEGKVSDIYIEKTELEKELQAINDQLGVLGSLIPSANAAAIQKLEAQANAILNQLRFVDNIIREGQGLANLIQAGADNLSITESFDKTMTSFATNRVPISITMQYKVFDNIIIESFNYDTDNKEFNSLTFSMRLKQVTFIESQLEKEAAAPSPSTGAKKALSPVINKGTAVGRETSLLQTVIQTFSGSG